jgi:type IV pilus assembly protein PilV
MKSFPVANLSNQKGIALLEALIAVVIFSFGMLGLAGLQAAMVKNTSDSKYRAEATFVAQQKLGEIWTDSSNLGNLAGYVVEESITQLPNGKRAVNVDSDRVVTVTISWQLPGEELHSYSTKARVEGVN